MAECTNLDGGIFACMKHYDRDFLLPKNIKGRAEFLVHAQLFPTPFSKSGQSLALAHLLKKVESLLEKQEAQIKDKKEVKEDE